LLQPIRDSTHVGGGLGLALCEVAQTVVHVSRRLTRKRSPLSAEFMCLLVVLAAGVATAWWAGHAVGMNLSVIETVASVLGIDERSSSTHQVGYTLEGKSAPPARYCQPGEAPTFANGLAALKQQVGNVMGTPLECEHADSAGGDTMQQTSTGLAAYNALTNTASFTDGWRHWALTPGGLVSWEGTDADPPAANASDPEPGPQ
jgi:hypothetical protein